MGYLNTGSKDGYKESGELRRPEDVAVDQLPASLLDAFLHVLVGVVLGDVPGRKENNKVQLSSLLPDNRL